jgi:hypothetical protein
MSGVARPLAEPAARLIAGNLDFEGELARAAMPARPRGADPFRLAPAASRAIAGLATLLRALARDGDRVWTPLAVDPARLGDAPGLPRVTLESGPLEAAPPAAALLAWGESPRVAALRARLPPAPASGAFEAAAFRSAPLHDALWKAPPPSAAAAARANDRRFALEIALRSGSALPGARTIGSLADLDAHLAAGGASASVGERWVLKAPYSAAGRWRHLGRGRSPLPRPAARAIENLLERFGELVFEPWLDRDCDFGLSAVLVGNEIVYTSLHRQLVDGAGRFRGIVLAPDGARLPEIGAGDQDLLLATLHAAAQGLASLGFQGPLTIDAWRYRRRDGALALNPLGEINARLSFGHVARALFQRLELTRAPAPPACAALLIGGAAGRAAGPRRVPLLAASPDAPLAAWMEVLDPGR